MAGPWAGPLGGIGPPGPGDLLEYMSAPAPPEAGAPYPVL